MSEKKMKHTYDWESAQQKIDEESIFVFPEGQTQIQVLKDQPIEESESFKGKYIVKVLIKGKQCNINISGRILKQLNAGADVYNITRVGLFRDDTQYIVTPVLKK